MFTRWAWLLVLGLVLGAGAGYGGSQLQTPVYLASTKVMITRSGQEQPLDVTAYLYGNQLGLTYLQLLQTSAVLSAAQERLGVDLTAANIDSQAIRDTSILEIKVEHTSPQLAAAIANTLVEVLIEQNENIQSGRYVMMEESLLVQKAQLEKEIASLQSQIEQAADRTLSEQEAWLVEQIASLEQEQETLNSEIDASNTLENAEENSDLEQKKARLEQVNLLLPLYQQSYTDLLVYGKEVNAAKGSANSQLMLLNTTLSLYQQLYVSVLSNLESVRMAALQNKPNVVPIEEAQVPQVPVRPKPIRNAILAGLVGVMLSGGIALLAEYLDNTIKDGDEIEKLIGFNPIGYIWEIKTRNKGEEGLYTAKYPRSPISEAFRSLRTNIEFASVDQPIRTILITSSEPGTGKTMVAANLAIVFAQKGKRVLLMDADLRRPQVHQVLNLPNRMGLTDLLIDSRNLETSSQNIDEVDGLTVLTSGGLPPNPAELLGSLRMERLLNEIKEEKDVIIIDSPPSIVADAQVLTARADGVILVIQPEKTRKDDIRITLELLRRANARILGIVLNRIPRKKGKYYNRYHYKGFEYTAYREKPTREEKKLEDLKTQGSRRDLFKKRVK